MADVTINELTRGTPAGGNVLPYSTGSNTLGVPVSAILQNAGNIGIGTSNPLRLLHVEGIRPGSQQVPLHVGFGESSIGFGVLECPVIFGWNGTLNSAHKPLSIRSTSATQLYLNTDGKVGIGTSTPTAKLHVDGDIKCTSTVINGVRTMYFSGLSNGNQTISCAVYLNQGNPVKVQCSFNHWSQPEYNATRESYIGASHYADPYYPMLVDDILNKSSALGGGWSFSRPVTNANPGPGYTYPLSDKLVITKSAGTYVGSSHWWIKIEGNAVGLGVYPA